MKDRVPTYPNLVQLHDPVNDTTTLYEMTMADQPTEEGTPLNKALFDHVIAAFGTTAGTAGALTLAGDGGFTLTDGATILFRLHADTAATPTINVNGTGAKALMSDYYTPMDSGIKAGTWISATYCAAFDFFVLRGSGAKFQPFFKICTASESVTIPTSGQYRITAIGAGADGAHGSTTVSTMYAVAGGCGGGGYVEKRLLRNDTLDVVIGTSASVSKDGAAIITATAGGTSGSNSTLAPLAGSVSGTGATGFSSNGTATKDVAPPNIYPTTELSKGGDAGWSQAARNGDYSQTGSAGGIGLYGGDGGAGGSGYEYSHNGYYDKGSTDGATGGTGAGNGGQGLGLAKSVGGSYRTAQNGGSGGGGGFGGGGGAPWGYNDSNSINPANWVFGGEGKGGAAAVIIERLY